MTTIYTVICIAINRYIAKFILSRIVIIYSLIPLGDTRNQSATLCVFNACDIKANIASYVSNEFEEI
jgi:hypothetical protein